VLETAPLNAAELAEYCVKGLYPEQISAWRAACRSANANATEQAREQRHQSKDDKKRIQQLEKELQRKEKALAEAACAADSEKKKPRRFGETKRTINQRPGSPVMCIVDSRGGAVRRRLEKACDELGLSLRTFQRWVGDGDAVLADGRTTTRGRRRATN